jgi:hypothetical protein
LEQSSYIRKTELTAFVIVVATVWIILLLVAAGIAHGQGQGPCTDDAAKFCKDVQPGGGRIMKCMKEHENDLSPACKARIAVVKKGLKDFREACQDDALRLCKDIRPGGGRIISCLMEHMNELSPECKTKVEKVKMKMQRMKPSPAY